MLAVPLGPVQVNGKKDGNRLPLSFTFAEPLMSELRPVDQSQNAAFRARLEGWLNEQNQTLLEEVMATWQKALGRFHPDGALLAQLLEDAAVAAPAPSDPQDADLAAALDLLEGAASQGDLLKRLLEALSKLVERSAIFILKQGLASLYAHRGFAAGVPARSGAVVPPAELEQVIQGSIQSIRRKGPGYSALIEPLGGFEAAEVAIFALRHKRRVVALVLVDSGLRQTLDRPEQARALALGASAMLAALATGKEEDSQPHPTLPEAHPSAPTQRVPEPIEAAAPMDLDAKTRAAAERLARVLVGDVELYFPAKVGQARAQGNLYGQLREELERSRATFVDRFGEGVEAKYRIFTTTVIQQLCDGDASKLGAAPWA
jgi:thioesterase domain-containing protein